MFSALSAFSTELLFFLPVLEVFLYFPVTLKNGALKSWLGAPCAWEWASYSNCWVSMWYDHVGICSFCCGP